MQFKDVLDSLVQMVNLELQPINDSNDALIVLDVDFKKKRYTLEKTSTTKKRTRPFSELNRIWDVLSQKGFVNVEQALAGAGSSRHQPETILANLPYVEHFKYEQKKHLYLRNESTHELGSIKELKASEVREIKKRIDRYRDFDISQFYSLHSNQVSLLKEKLNNIFIKYPGESDVDSIESILAEIQDLDFKLSEAVVSIDDYSSDFLSQSEESEDEQESEDDNNVNINNNNNNNNNNKDNSYDEDSKNKNSEGLQNTRISQVTPTVSLIYDRVNYKEIDLQPEFQRGDRIWPEKDKGRLIESVLLRLPLPVFYFAERPNEDPDADSDFDWVVIDGLQRITALVGYMKGDYPLKNLKQLPKFDGLFFKDLPRKEQRKIREYQIHGHLIQISKDSDEMIRELFHRINTYGKNLSAQEIRSALYPGSANRFLKYFADENEFIDAIPAKINSDRMLDIEYILRAVGFLILGYEKYIYKTADDFLSHTMKVMNESKYIVDENIKNSGSLYIEIDYRLKESFETITKIFGDSAYKKEEGGRVNKMLFELLVPVFAFMSDEQRRLVSNENNAEQVKSKLFEMIKDDYKNNSVWISDIYTEQNRGFNYAISNSTSKRVTVLYRFRSIVKMINDITNMGFYPLPLLEDKNKKVEIKK